jgi:cob(I)alamin adenosyltransferase
LAKIPIYTRRGDFGETSLCDGSRTTKDSVRVEAYGSVDELNSLIGLAIVKLEHKDLKVQLIKIQHELHALGSNLAFPSDLTQASIQGPAIAKRIPRITGEMVTNLEEWIDEFEKELPELRHFILCGGNEVSALLHVARTACRRAERNIVKLKHEEEIAKNLLKYVNRLSDYLFTAARVASFREGNSDIVWNP